MSKTNHYLWLLLIAFSSMLQATTTIQNLRVDYMRNPVGIDSPSPQFSWEMHADERGMKQIAYELHLLDEDRNSTLWSSGKIDSDVSVGIQFPNIPLEASAKYGWAVDVWDNKGSVLTSTEEAYFVTGLMQSGWSGANWLKIKEKIVDDTTVNFDLSCDITVVSQNAGVIFGASDIHNMHMWAINTHQLNHPVLRRHIFENGNLVTVDDVPLPAQFTHAAILGHERNFKIEVENRVVHTYLDGILIDSYHSPKLKNGYIGFRVYTGDNNTYEHAYIDNVVYNYFENGTAKSFTEDFEKGSNDFDALQTIVVDGNTKLDLVSQGNADLRVLQNASQGIPLFRSEFVADKPVKSAYIYATALGVYDLFVNGNRVGRLQEDGTTIYDEMKPGWTDYRKTVFYDTYDITHLLETGDNAVGAAVSPGWFTGNIAHHEYGQHPLGFMAKIRIEYTDGSIDNIVTNTTDWQASTQSAVRMADIYDGETYDARMESEWTTVGGQRAADWSETATHNYFQGDVLAFIGERVRVRPEMELTPKNITIYAGTNDNGSTYGEINVLQTYAGEHSIQLKKGGTAIYDFGQNFVGWIRFKVQGQRGSRLTARFAEMLNDSGANERGNDGPKGSLYLRNLRSAKATLRYILKGDDAGEIYNPSMTFFGFRYCEIQATQDITLTFVTGEVLGNVNEENAGFLTDHALVNQLYSNVIWGQRGNFLSVPTDCPQRDERLGWMGDTQVFSRAAAYNADVASFFNKWAKDVRDSQQADGTYPSVVPDNWNVGYGRTAWAEAGIIVPWNIYLMYGNKNMLKIQYASMEKFMDWMATRKFDGYLYNGGDTQYGDWLAYEHTDARLISVSYYAYVADLMAKISKALSSSPNDIYAQNEVKYQNLYEQIKAEFQDRYISTRTGNLSVTSQTAYLLALKHELFPDEAKAKQAATQLVNKIRQNGNRLSTGFVGTAILNQTLSEIGADTLAYSLLLQRDDPSWLYSVDQGATTIWERWNSYTIASGFGDPGMNSFNHYAYGAVSEWMFRFVAGIETDENKPGFKHIILQPMPDFRKNIPTEQMKWADAYVGSYYGKIASKWEQKSDGDYRFKFTIPANTTATCYIPKYRNNMGLFEGSTMAADVEGVVSFKEEKERFVLEIESGSYVFEVRDAEQSGSTSLKRNNSISLYPNPVQDKLMIRNGGELLAHADIYDIFGSPILKTQLSDDFSLEVSDLNTGIYILKIQTDRGYNHLKFCKK